MTEDANVDLSSSLAVRLRRAEAAIRARLHPLLDDNGLSMEHWRIIAVVDDNPGISMRSVAIAAVVPAATLTRHMDKLVEHGVVVRHVDPADKRRVVAALSPRGRTLAAHLREQEKLADIPANVELTDSDAGLHFTA
ncbi:MarR family transcriptional regulator [Nocardioides immobilis]|uniref:MarR family transcriptional regulator n=1 Tax=Nocardioides immobilis TaxID=2049295 RepID=A0A417Y383_9ACTN|nr:MarR family transcriptional regulator [Nocardioides immobilis]RHW27055.1 MarR family transcriptional regulator [Nocardioides immobilis]